jgi:hypothetical protein
MVEENSLRINLIKDGIGVLLLACCKYYYFPCFPHFLYERYGVWPQIHSDFEFLRINTNSEPNISLALQPLKAMQ